MKALIFILGTLLAGSAMAEATVVGALPAPQQEVVTTPKPTLKNLENYSAVVCRLEEADGSPLVIFSEQLMRVKMDDHWGLFKQMRAQIGIDQLQLQILLEDDFAKSNPGAINVLVNFAVNGNEISQEFAGQNITYASVKHLKYEAHCELH